jgi:hypothetical protein
MAVLLGDQGRIELRRASDSRTSTVNFNLNTADINATKNRFSFTPSNGGPIPILSGDRVSIRVVDPSALLTWFDDYSTQREATVYAHVDAAGGIYLYHNYTEAINGETTGRLSLSNNVTISPAHTIKIEVGIYKILGQVVSYELNTEREAVDVTALSDDFRKSTSGLISGSGRLTALFDYRRNPLDPEYEGVLEDRLELPFYISQLVLRTGLGSEFNGKFFVVTEGNKAYGTSATRDDIIWYECDARVTSAAIDFAASEAVEMTVDFVTTGTITLQTGFESPGRILQSNNGKILLGQYQNTGFGALLKNTP